MEYLKYGLPSMLMILIKFYCIESLMIMSGYIGVTEQGASVIIFNFTAFLFMGPLGMGFSAGNLVGTNLGTGKAATAKRYADVCLIVAIIWALVFDIFLFFGFKGKLTTVIFI